MLVLEYMEGGDLAAALQNDSGSGVLADRKLRWYAQGASLARDIAEALVFLHSRQVRPSSAELQYCLAPRPGSAVTLQTFLSMATALCLSLVSIAHVHASHCLVMLSKMCKS